MTEQATTDDIKTPDDLRAFLQSTEQSLADWANKKITSLGSGYTDAVKMEWMSHKADFHFWTFGRLLDMLDAQAARIKELENRAIGDGK